MLFFNYFWKIRKVKQIIESHERPTFMVLSAKVEYKVNGLMEQLQMVYAIKIRTICMTL